MISARSLVLAAAGSLLAVSLAGCGAQSLARPASSSQSAGYSGFAKPVAAPAKGPAGTLNVQAMLAAVRQTTAGLQGFSATVKVHDSGPAGVCDQVLKVAFKKPHNLRLTVQQDTGSAQGSQVLYTGGDQIKVHPNFPPVTVSLSLDDNRLKSKNGFTLKDTGVEAIQTVLLDPGAKLVPLPNATMNGKSMAMVEVHSPASPHGVTKEIIGVDRANNLPTYREMYMGDKVVYRLSLQSLNLATPSASEMSL